MKLFCSYSLFRAVPTGLMVIAGLILLPIMGCDNGTTDPQPDPTLSFTTTPQTVATLVLEKRTLVDTLEAVDSENLTMTFSSPDTLPDGMVLDAASGVLSWTPSTAQLGDYPVRFRVTNTAGLTTSLSYTISVITMGGLFPDDAEVTGWAADSAAALYDTMTIYMAINGGIIPYEEHGYYQAAFQTWRNDQNSINLEVYDQRADSGAANVFPVVAPQFNYDEISDIGDEARLDLAGSSTYRLVFRRHHYYVQITCGKTDDQLAAAKNFAALLVTNINKER